MVKVVKSVVVFVIAFFILFSTGFLMQSSPKTGYYELTNETFTADPGNYVELSQSDIAKNTTMVYNSTTTINASTYEINYEEGAIECGLEFEENDTYSIDYDFRDHTGREKTFMNAIEVMIIPFALLAFLGLTFAVLGKGGF